MEKNISLISTVKSTWLNTNWYTYNNVYQHQYAERSLTRGRVPLASPVLLHIFTGDLDKAMAVNQKHEQVIKRMRYPICRMREFNKIFF